MIINTGERTERVPLILSCYTVVIAFCNRGCTDGVDGRVIILNPAALQRVVPATINKAFTSLEPRIASQIVILRACGISHLLALRKRLACGKNDPRGFAPSLVKPRVRASIRPPVINFALSRTTIFTLPDDVATAELSRGAYRHHQHTTSRVATSNSARLGPAWLGQQARRLRLPTKIARHIFTILLHF